MASALDQHFYWATIPNIKDIEEIIVNFYMYFISNFVNSYNSNNGGKKTWQTPQYSELNVKYCKMSDRFLIILEGYHQTSSKLVVISCSEK